MNESDAVLSWLGLAIALVVLQEFGLGTFARYTLIAVIIYAVLTNVPRVSALFDRFERGIAAGVAGGRTARIDTRPTGPVPAYA